MVHGIAEGMLYVRNVIRAKNVASNYTVCLFKLLRLGSQEVVRRTTQDSRRMTDGTLNLGQTMFECEFRDESQHIFPERTFAFCAGTAQATNASAVPETFSRKLLRILCFFEVENRYTSIAPRLSQSSRLLLRSACRIRRREAAPTISGILIGGKYGMANKLFRSQFPRHALWLDCGLAALFGGRESRSCRGAELRNHRGSDGSD